MEKTGLLYDELIKKIFSVEENSFTETALSVFNHQYQYNEIYKKFCDSLKVGPENVNHVSKIPFLPIEFFKTHVIKTESQFTIPPAIGTKSQIFLSSGTTHQIQSKHFVSDISVYEKSFRKGFELFYGDVKNICVLALLPSYLEREGSSLIYMCDDLIKNSKNENSGFYLNEFDKLISKINLLEKAGQKTILIGVTYALLDLIEKQTFNLKHTIIMETGGMKGKREEMVREELHEKLCEGFGVNEIHSEYGMTELLSQAYSKGKGIFNSPPWMKILIRDTEDPFTFLADERTGGINVIDLSNINSCSFIATQDLGRTHPDKTFEVLGRFDNSDIRGCNLLVD